MFGGFGVAPMDGSGTRVRQLCHALQQEYTVTLYIYIYIIADAVAAGTRGSYGPFRSLRARLEPSLWRQLLTKLVLGICTDHIMFWSKGAVDQEDLLASSSLCEFAL